MKEGKFLPADAWQALGASAGAVLTAASTLSYIGPVFALFGYAIKQWSTCQEVPQMALTQLQSCRDLLFDLNQAWPYLVLNARQEQQRRLQSWVLLVAEAAAQCVEVNEKGPCWR
jgi:hypothetical protein